jgi:hypothetical protein
VAVELAVTALVEEAVLAVVVVALAAEEAGPVAVVLVAPAVAVLVHPAPPAPPVLRAASAHQSATPDHQLPVRQALAAWKAAPLAWLGVSSAVRPLPAMVALALQLLAASATRPASAMAA